MVAAEIPALAARPRNAATQASNCAFGTGCRRVAGAEDDEDEKDVGLPPQDASAVANNPNPIMRRVSIGFALFVYRLFPHLPQPRVTSRCKPQDRWICAVLGPCAIVRHLALSRVTAYICLPWPRKNQTPITR